MAELAKRDDCTGCKACGDICMKGAVSFQEDKEGFWYPVIDPDKCVSCGRCQEACPVMSGGQNNKNEGKPEVYAAYTKDLEIRYNSTSGGMYYELARAILAQGGYLAGCAYKEDYSGAVHIIADTEAGLKKIMRSKYFQSDTEGIYKAVKSLLQKEEKVLFCGAPCQVSALYHFLGKEYPNLFTVDFVCRGINSPLAYRKFLEELEKKYQSPVKEVHFKNKSRGWTNLGTLVTFENGKQYYRGKGNDPWVNAFVVGNLYMRPSCHNCKFKKLPRVSDLSIGDFWGMDFTKEEARYGVSLVMVNNEKGKKLFSCCKERLVIQKKSLQEALAGNGALLNATPRGKRREEFFERIQTEPYSKVVWDILGKKWPKWWLDYQKSKARKTLSSAYHHIRTAGKN